MDEDDGDRSVLARWAGVLELSLQRVGYGLRRPGPSRVPVAVAIVAVAVAVLVVVTGLSLGLASQPAVDDPGTTYWVTPESADALTTLTAADGPNLGDVHRKSEQLAAHDDINHATPILIEVLEMRTDPETDSRYIIAIGVVDGEERDEIAGVSTAALTAGDPYFDGGSYDGGFTGQVVLSPAAAELLGADAGESLLISRPGPGAVDQSFSVADVSAGEARTVQGEAPVALFQLSELQAFTGNDAGDQANQILVHAESAAAVPMLEDAYPHGTVVERGALDGDQLVDSELPLAVSVSAFVVVLVVTTLVVATVSGIDIEADRQRLAVFAALGVGTRSTTGLVAIRTLALAVLGGVVGAFVGAVGIVVLNHVVAPHYGLAAFATLSPGLVGYGIAVAAVAGLLAVPYPVVLARRIPTLQELTR